MYLTGMQGNRIVNTKNNKILIMAAGTGGHVFPALAVAATLKERGADITWLGTPKGIEQKLVPAAGIPLLQVSITGLRGKGLLGWLSAPYRISHALFQSMQILNKVKPAVILGMGGYVTGPAGVAAWLLRIPVVIHEQNRIPGLTNRLLSFFAKRVLMAFPDTFRETKKSKVVGNPIRKDITLIKNPEQRFSERDDSIRILVLGGSQGAKALNETVPEVIAKLVTTMKKPVAVQIHHQTGQRAFKSTRDTYSTNSISANVSPFIDDMAAEYSWADIVICRAGALTISELTMAGLGAILIPFPFAVDDHQFINAEYMHQNGAANVIRQNEQLFDKLFDYLLQLFSAGRDAMLKMAINAKQLAMLNSAEQVADVCIEVQHG